MIAISRAHMPKAGIPLAICYLETLESNFATPSATLGTVCPPLLIYYA